jgi:uncharacterized protein YndB with AHSA1/START domain
VTGFATSVAFPQPPETAYTFLVDPWNRPKWQSSLRTVADVDPGEPFVGMHWRDVTRVGLWFDLEITELEPHRLFTEVGTWHGVDARLTLRFTPDGSGTRVDAEGRLEGRGPLARAISQVGRIAAPAIAADLRRAARLAGPRAGH